MVNQDNVIAISSSSRYTLAQVRNVFRIIGRYHEGTIYSTMIKALELIPSKAGEIADELGLSVTENDKKTIPFTNEEILDLLPLIEKGDNIFAKHYLMYLCMPIFTNYWKRHSMLDMSLTTNDNYWDTMALAYGILDECASYYYKLYESGGIKVNKGHDKVVEFPYFLRLRLNDVARTVTSENQPLSYGDGITKNINKIRKFVKDYETKNGGKTPSLAEIAEVIKIKNLETVQTYMDIVNTTFVCGNEEERTFNGTPGENGENTVYDSIADEASDFSQNGHIDRFAVREAIQKLDPTASKIICLKYGIIGEPHTDAEVQKILSIDEKLYRKTLKETIDILSVKLSDFQSGVA